MEHPRYKAFISYSHHDERWARWLQRSLERYRVPRRLVGNPGTFGEVPARLRPVFRDREDLSSASDLTGRIKEELERSEFLVVICSPATAASHWVGEEIRYFRELGRDDRILALVVDGDPVAGEAGESCFPDALTEAPGGLRREPLAADVRRYADGKHLALLKIIAGLLGVRLDELRRRDAHRRLQQRLIWGLATVVLIAVLGWLLYAQATTRAAAQMQRVNTEELLSYMLGDLQRLDSIAGVESMVLDLSDYENRFSRLGLTVLDGETLFERAMAWRDAGLEHRWEGDLDQAMEWFRNSHAALVALYKKEGSTDRALFELGQAEFYVGEVMLARGEPQLAREHFTRYGVFTRRLLNRTPNDPKYVMELSYTLMNLAVLEHVFLVPDSDKSLQLMQAALQYNQMALVLDPSNPQYQDSLASQLAWLADTWLLKCALGNALETRKEAVELRRMLSHERPDSAYHQRELAFALNGLAGVQQQIGLTTEAVTSFEEAMGILQRMHDAEPGNEGIEWELLYRSARLARLLLDMDEVENAAVIIEPLAERLHELGNDSGDVTLARSTEAAMFSIDQARLQRALGKSDAADRWLLDSVERFVNLARENPGKRESAIGLALASFLYWERFDSLPSGIGGLFPNEFPPRPGSAEDCPMIDLAARLALAEGDTEQARAHVDHALSRGYFAPNFISFCKRYELCDLH